MQAVEYLSPRKCAVMDSDAVITYEVAQSLPEGHKPTSKPRKRTTVISGRDYVTETRHCLLLGDDSCFETPDNWLSLYNQTEPYRLITQPIFEKIAAAREPKRPDGTYALIASVMREAA